MNYEKLKDLADRLRAVPATRRYANIITKSLTAWHSRQDDPSLLVELDIMSSWLKGSMRYNDARVIQDLASAMRERARDQVIQDLVSAMREHARDGKRVNTSYRRVAPTSRRVFLTETHR
jgi:hypothetical protein